MICRCVDVRQPKQIVRSEPADPVKTSLRPPGAEITEDGGNQWNQPVRIVLLVRLADRLVESDAADLADERLLAAERDRTVRDAMSRLPTRWQDPVCLPTVDSVLVLNTAHVRVGAGVSDRGA
jgi:hypothetical protein